MKNELRKFGESYNYPRGAYVFYTEDKKLMNILKKEASGIQEYIYDRQVVAWDLIFPNKNHNLKNRLISLTGLKNDRTTRITD